MQTASKFSLKKTTIAKFTPTTAAGNGKLMTEYTTISSLL